MSEYFKNLIEENIKQLKVENDAYLKQKDEKINLLEEEIKNKIQKINCDSENKIEDFQKLIEEKFQQLKIQNDQKEEKINCLEKELKTVKAENDVYLKQKDEKIFSLEKEVETKIQKINCDYKNEIKEMKGSIEQLKTENDQKNEKINLLEEEIIKEKRKRELVEFVNKNEIKILNSKMNEANDLMDKKIGDLIKANNSNLVEFVEIKNKWSEIYGICCSNLCINSLKPIGNCIEGNGFGNIIDNENIKYIGVDEGFNKYVCIYAENLFNNPQNSLNYSLHYFEIKCKIEGELNKGNKLVAIGFKNYSTNKYIYYAAHNARICYEEKDKEFKLSTSFNNNDIFGCGLVYPPTNKLNRFPYIFFTRNGEQIGKAILLDNFDSYQPNVDSKCYSIETNFGNDLKTKPFKYDIFEHSVLKEFY
uniref:Uncharacterized protein n=1 Tax=Meloidogyne enterolobii TaxID=390850 RepID=A0A6V7WGN0_MELEN|nr:unnamed protein product [Meloidogyne enterolobii]